MSKNYETIEEASKAAIKLGIISSPDYSIKYKLDPKLPSTVRLTYGPELFDSLGGWDWFLNRTTRYKTLEEASTAAIKLGIVDSTDYNRRYKQDPKLPAEVRRIYDPELFDNLGGWDWFLNRTSLYKTLEEASKATIKLGILTTPEYKVRYKEDPQLPFSPHLFYGRRKFKSFGGWNAFSGQIVKLSFLEAKEKIKKEGTIKTIRDYRDYIVNHKDSKLPKKPYIKYSEEWKNWFDFLSVPEKPIYKSLNEALSACKTLKINTPTLYGIHSHTDPQLPTSLAEYYHNEWQSWRTHFDFEIPYDTWEAAQSAINKLNIKTLSEYKKLYKNDPKLVWNPDVVYEEVWFINGGWHGFIGNIMGTITAANYIKSQGINDLSSYQSLQKRTNFLPEDPISYYDLLVFDDLLNIKMYELSDIKKYCKRKNIKTVKGYLKLCRNQEHLPQLDVVDGYININSIIDTNFCQFRNLPESYSEWITLAKRYSNLGKNISRKEALIRIFIQDYLIKNNQPCQPAKFFLRGHNPIDMEAFFENAPASDKLQSSINILKEFVEYAFKECCQDEDPYTKEIMTLPGFINKWNAIYCLEDVTQEVTPSQSDKPPLPMNYLDDAANFLIPPEANSFSDTYHLEADWYDVDELIIDKNDPDCVWRKVNTTRGKKQIAKYQMWSPVRTCGLVVLFRMPFRGQQICWLDSGEADEEIPILNDKNEVEWIKNENKLVNSFGKHKKAQGFVKRFNNQIEKYIDDKGKEAYRYTEIVGSNITTNKTSAFNGGYDVAYMHPSLIKWMIKLRKWQTKYNPVSDLTAWSDIPMRNRRNANVLKSMKSQAFLFRDPTALEIEKRSFPILRAKMVNPFAWLLYQIQDPENPLAESLDVNSKSMNAYSSEFTPHAMRVSMISAYVLDGQLPVSIVAKLVGHASLVMTIYYTKTDNHDLYESLSIADHKVLAEAPARVADMIKNGQISLSSSEFIGPDGSTIPQHYQNLPFAALAFKDFGICPYAGAKCYEGGEHIDGTNKDNKHGPVRSGYLGPSNCFACRFFITGPAFIGGLQTYFAEVSLEGKLSGERVEKYRIEIEKLEDLKYEADELGSFFEGDVQLNKLRNLELKESKKLSTLAEDAILIGVYAARSKRLTSTSSVAKNSFQLITSDKNDFFKIELEETSEFRQLYEICKNAEIYTCANPQRALPKRTILIDKFASINGLKPSMCLLSEEEQLEVGNQITNIVLARLNGNWNDADKLFSGELFLEDLGISSAEIMKPIEDKNKFIMNKSNLIEVANVE